MIYVISQVFGICGFIASLIAFHRKDKRNILKTSIISNILDLIHYLLLGAYSGAITKVLAMLRNYFVILKEKYPKLSNVFYLIIFVILYVLASVITYNGLFSVLPLLAALIYILVLWNGDEQKVRMAAFFGYILWLIYNIFVFSIAGIISNAVSIISVLIAIINNMKKVNKEVIK